MNSQCYIDNVCASVDGQLFSIKSSDRLLNLVGEKKNSVDVRNTEMACGADDELEPCNLVPVDGIVLIISY